MIPWWKHLNFLIKHQLYVRILPVVVIAVMGVGFFSGRLLTSRAVNTYLEQREEKQAAALTELLGTIGMRALAAEAHKDESIAGWDWSYGHASLVEQNLEQDLLEGFLDFEGVQGVSVVPISPWVQRDSPRVTLAADLRSETNSNIMQAWIQQAWRNYLGYEWLALGSGMRWTGGPRQTIVDDFHSLMVFDPVNLARAKVMPEEAWAAEVAPEFVPVLPVVVREKPSFSDLTSPEWQRPQILLLLDIPFLLAGSTLAGEDPDNVGLLLDTGGQLLYASVDSLTAGYELTGDDREVFPGVSGAELGSFLKHSGCERSHAYLGRQWDPYVFMLTQRSELPLLLVSALPFSKIHGGMVLYTAIVVLMAVIAFLGSILAITSVGEVLSDRMQAMAVYMEEVAKGDYTRRMPVGKEDEVGRLVRYFNLMTAALEEAHHELREKTHKLRIALARMKRLDKAKDDFLSLISHEVRTPLTSIMGSVEFFKMVLPTASEEQLNLLEQLNLIEITEIIESNGHRLNEFMNDAIMMTALQSTDMKVEFTPVPMCDLCELVLSGLQESIISKQLTVANELADNGTWSVLGDRDLMITALDKLLRNAVQHNYSHGRVRICEVEEIVGMGGVKELLMEKTRRELSSIPSFARWLDLDVRWRIVMIYNTGNAIPEEKRDTLFRKFELVGHIEHHHKGSGLSMSIVQAVLENHGGKVFVQSRENDGNYFYLLIPTVDLEAGADDLDGSGHEEGNGIDSTAWHKDVHLMGNFARLDVELEHTRS